ncbi:MAG: MFS transporter, partial [Polaribacter sp.]
KDILTSFSWKSVLLSTSILASFGGLLLLILVPNGPYRKASKTLDLKICFTVFKNIKFRKAAFGYFGHMWELYTFWAFVPILLKTYQNTHSSVHFNIPLFSFFVIAVGGLSCVLGGYLAQKFGARKIAFSALLLSCICCLISPLLFFINNEILFISFLLFWGMVVIADSPLFSTLVAQNAPEKDKGTALTIVNCIGFTITIISIQFISNIQEITDSNFIYALLGIGPIIGLAALKNKSASIN